MIANGLVLVHGWAMNATVWEGLRWPQAWQSRIMALDLPGYGKTQESLDMDSLPALADWFIARAPRDRVWLGWSLGGMVLLQAVATLAAQSPTALPAALVLVGVTPKFVNDLTWHYGVDEPILDTFAESFIEYRSGIKDFLHLQLGNSRQQRGLAMTMSQVLLAQQQPLFSTLMDGINILRNADLRPRLSTVTVPVRVLQGSRDRVCSMAAASYLTEHLPQAELIVFPRCGHIPFVECPQQFVTAVCGDWAGIK